MRIMKINAQQLAAIWMAVLLLLLMMVTGCQGNEVKPQATATPADPAAISEGGDHSEPSTSASDVEDASVAPSPSERTQQISDVEQSTNPEQAIQSEQSTEQVQSTDSNETSSREKSSDPDEPTNPQLPTTPEQPEINESDESAKRDDQQSPEQPSGPPAPSASAEQPANPTEFEPESEPEPDLPQEQPPSVIVSIRGHEEMGEILASTSVALESGDTVLDVLKRVTREKKIQMEFRGMGMLAYVEGINNLYELDHGPESGWVYHLNGEESEKGAGLYKPQSGDRIEWLYTMDLGEDVEAE